MGSHSAEKGFRNQLARLWRWYAPRVPSAIATSLSQAQFENVRRQAPMLLAVAGINVALIMAVCAHDGLPFAIYGWMSLLLLYCLVRLAVWSKLLQKPVDPASIPRILRMNTVATLAMMTFLGIDASLIFLFKLFKSELLAPISLGFGAMAIAHCFYSLRPAAIGVLVMGMLPTSLVMIATGNFEAKMIGCAMITVGTLMIRFVADQYDRMIAGLFLEKQIRELADSDPLTGLPNRRAIMAAIANEMQAKNGFGIALLDLDGFKQVNDSLGHQAGDLMLLGVGGRLSDASLESDSVARLGGDEFIVLFRNVADKGELAARTTALLVALCRPIDLDGHRLPVAASLGYAMYPDDGDTIREVMHAADTALYAEKRASKAARQSSPNSLPKVA
jgi:diguanylate cyclase (GGDEF)-like protein